jgi:predicted RNA-binding protein YlxR (DUF448 family)
MTRLVRNGDGGVSLDPTGKAVGRGTYVCNETACREPRRLAEAVSRALGAALEPSELAIEESHATT